MIEVNFFNQYDDNGSYQEIIEYIIHFAYKEMSLTEDLIVNIILVDDSSIHSMNLAYRGIDTPTDVLSFENTDTEGEIGDIFISIDKVKSQAIEYEHSFNRELAFLTLHGFLHCLGYDHLTEEDEKRMFELQKNIIEKTDFRRKIDG